MDNIVATSTSTKKVRKIVKSRQKRVSPLRTTISSKKVNQNTTSIGRMIKS